MGTRNLASVDDVAVGGFGEIALLRDIPRTATVRAATDVRLRALARPAFLAAITQHGEAESMSRALVDERLSRPPVSGKG